MKYVDSNWVTVGSADFSAGNAFYESIAIDPSGGASYLAFTNGEGGSVSVMKYVGDTATEINNMAENNFTIYPNPTVDVIHVTGLQNMEGTLKISDIMGRILCRQPANGAAIQTINISSLAGGMYLLVCESKGQVLTGKIAKQ